MSNSLKKLSLVNEVRIDDFRGHKRTPPYHFDSLRHAFGYYFNTFITNNVSYEFYAEGLAGRNVSILKSQYLDEDNTVLTIIAFERFFELFIKDLLRKVHSKLILIPKGRLQTIDILNQIQSNTFQVKVDHETNKPLTVPFRQTLKLFYDLFVYGKNASPYSSHQLVKKFKKIAKSYIFFDSPFHRESLETLNWYRDRILHRGNKLPSPWLLDYLVSQRFIPIAAEIFRIDKAKLGDSLFYTQTITDIDIIAEFLNIKFEFNDLKSKRKKTEIFYKLLKIGHLKELGRANINMNLFVRQNRATYEYNYDDVKGRGRRFALSEDNGGHPDFKEIRLCPCCDVNSLVVYQSRNKDFLNRNIEWVKCYTCDYHIRYNVADPMLFDLSQHKYFQD